MMLGTTHVGLPVADLERAWCFYGEGLGFALIRRAEGWLDLDGHGVVLRLEKVSGAVAPLTLRLQTTQVEEAATALVAAGARQLLEPSSNLEDELQAVLADPDGHRLVIWRELSEDELETAPELPITLSWSPGASTLLQTLLGEVPALFRAIARGRATAEAELLARDRQRVEENDVIRAYIRSTPRLMRERARQPLIDQGIDPDAYGTDFES